MNITASMYFIYQLFGPKHFILLVLVSVLFKILLFIWWFWSDVLHSHF